MFALPLSIALIVTFVWPLETQAQKVKPVLPPDVTAGPDQTITLPASARLAGTFDDRNLPAHCRDGHGRDSQQNPHCQSTFSPIWSQVTGPGTVTFGNVSALSTTSGFPAAGFYVFRLTVSIGLVSSTAEIAITVNGPNYYVDAAGGSDSNPGTFRAPWKTIQKAADTVQAGARVYVRPGSYNERVRVTRSGAAGFPVTFQAYSGVTTLGFSINASHIRVLGFNITTRTGSFPEGIGIYILGSYNEIVNNWIHDTCRQGILADAGVSPSHDSAATSYNTIRGNTVVRAQRGGVWVEGQNNLVESNDISHTLQSPPGCGTFGDADGILYFGIGHTIRKNYVHDILLLESPTAHIDATQTWGAARNIIFEQNTFDIPDSLVGNPAVSAGTGFTMESLDGPVDNLIIRNNLVINRHTGYAVDTQSTGGNLRNLTIVNNTFARLDGFGVGGGMGIWITSKVENARIENNAFYDYGYAGDNYIRVTGGSGVVIGNNSITKTNGVAPTGSPYPNDLWMVDARFVNPAARDFHLQRTSPLIDAGAAVDVTNDHDGVARPQGPRLDIGAYEFF